MYTAKDFADRYQKMSNAQLLELLQNPAHYQLEAFLVAKAEFAARQLSDSDIEEAKQALLSKKLQKEKQDEKLDATKAKLLDAGNSLYDTVNPVQSTAPTAEKLIRLVSLVFAVLVVFKIVTNANQFYGLLTGDSYGSFGYTIILFPVLVQITAIVFFWMRKHIGWILLAAFCSYSLVQQLYALYLSITLQFGYDGFSQFFPSPPPAAFIISIIFYAGTLLVMKRPDVMEIFKMDKQGKQSAIVLGALVGAFSTFLAIFS